MNKKSKLLAELIALETAVEASSYRKIRGAEVVVLTRPEGKVSNTISKREFMRAISLHLRAGGGVEVKFTPF